jgi:hypothetical protein
LAYLDHFCPHLDCFRKTNSFPYFYVKTLVLANPKYLSRLVLIKIKKNSPFSHNQISPTQESSFCNKRVLIKIKYTYAKILKNSQAVANPVALALFSPSLALSTKTEN